jgi:hypothetical protein
MKALATCLLACLALAACSGTEIIPDDTAAFAASGMQRYAWRTDPLPAGSFARDRLYEADPAIRDAVDGRLAELGYREVPREDAQFLVDYLAAVGFNDGVAARNASNITPYQSSAMINRQINQAEVDNAQALAGVRETGNIALVFIDAGNRSELWKVRITALVQDSNRVDTNRLKRVIRSGLSSLPAAATAP